MQIQRLFSGRILNQALTTKGYAHEHHLGYDNQRLEFLGDAVLDLIVSEHLYNQTELAEGELTRLRSSAVCEASLARLAKRFKLDEDLRVANGQKLIDSLLADAFEAFIGAYFISNGYEQTREFVEQSILPLIDLTEDRDPKTALQEYFQARGVTDIQYKTISQTGPPHDCEFIVSLEVSEKEVARGHGRSKKEAQKVAAANFLNRL